jgi:hypothetical protein
MSKQTVVGIVMWENAGFCFERIEKREIASGQAISRFFLAANQQSGCCHLAEC